MPQRLILVIVLIVIGLQMSLGASGASVAAKQRPLDFGVVYSIPGDVATEDEIVRDLQKIKGRGFDHVNLSSWIWTLPTVGSPLRRRVDVILNWCDSHKLGVWLLQNVQYGSAEGGDFERSVTDPAEYVRPFVVDWVAALKGHSCVRGVILGNEVGPITPPDLQQTPRYHQAFIAWLQARYPAIASLNKNWDTHYKTFDQVAAPAESEPGWVDYHRFAQTQFGSFYSRIFDELIKPELGVSLKYGSKTSADPFLYRRYPGATTLCYDDLVAYYPIWIEKVLSDGDERPAFNSEIHLYNDHFNYYPSIKLTRYRYYMDALSNATANSSFDWGAWKSPGIAAIDKATPATLAEIRRLRPFLSALAASQRRSGIAVIVSESVFQASIANLAERPLLPDAAQDQGGGAGHGPSAGAPPLEDAYAAMASIGKPWRFVMDVDLAREAKQLDTVIIPGFDRYPLTTVQAIAALPKRVRVEWAGAWPTSDEYGHPLPAAALRSLKIRCHPSIDIYQAAKRLTDQRRARGVSAVVDVPYGWWSPRRGGYQFPVKYPRVEIRRAQQNSGRDIVALINNTHDPISFPLDALTRGDHRMKVWDATVDAGAEKSILLKPFDIHILLIPRQKTPH